MSVSTAIQNQLKIALFALKAACEMAGIDMETVDASMAPLMEAVGAAPTASKKAKGAKGAKKAKKEKDSDAPKKPMNKGLEEYNARYNAWFEVNGERVMGELMEAYETEKAAAEEAGIKFEGRKPTKAMAKKLFSETPEEKALKASKPKAEKKPRASKAKAKAEAPLPQAAAAAAVAAPSSMDDDDDKEWTPLTLNGKDYIYDDQGRCYLFVDGEKGAWSGVYDVTASTLDDTMDEF